MMLLVKPDSNGITVLHYASASVVLSTPNYHLFWPRSQVEISLFTPDSTLHYEIEFVLGYNSISKNNIPLK